MKIFVIGFGYMGRLHARVLSKMNLLGGIVDLDQKLREMAKKTYNVPVYGTIDELSNAEEVHALVLAVPTKYHNNTAIEVVNKIKSLKSFLIEKPMVANLNEYNENIEFWNSVKDKCIVGHIEVYNPVVTKFIEIIESNEYGKLRTINIERKSAVMRNRLDSLSGVVEDVGIHDLDILQRMISGKLSIFATSQRFSEKDNSVIAIVKSNDIQASLHFSREFSGRKRTITVELEKASIFVDLVAQTIEIRGLGEVIGDSDSVKVPHGPGSSIKMYGEPLQNELSNLRDIALGKTKPIVGVDNGLAALKLADAIIKSIETNSIVTIE